MAHSQHVSKLKEGARTWNAWRREHPGTEPQLGDLKLSVGHRQFGPAQGGPIDLSQADLCRAVLENATLISADLSGAYLVQANLSHARLSAANLRGANLSHARLDFADLKDAILDAATLCGAKLRDVRNLTQVQLERAYGDAHTVLPAGLAMPAAWRRNARSTQVARRGISRPSGRKVDPYTLLGVPRRASIQEIRAAYLALVKELHPDGRELDPVASEQLKAINKAYQDLKARQRLVAAREAEVRSNSRPRAAFAVSFLGSILIASAVVGTLYYAGAFTREEARRVAGSGADGAAATAAAPEAPSARQGRDAAQGPAKPDATALAKARDAADDAAWIEAEKEGTSAAFHRYLGRYANGRHARQAAAELPTVVNTEVALDRKYDGRGGAATEAARRALRTYLDLYPDGQLVPEVQRKLNAIAAAEAAVLAENEAWAAAEQVGTTAGLRRYLAAHPNGDNAAYARKAIAAIEASEARRRGDQAAWAEASKDGSKAGLRRYLGAYPDGDHAAYARQTLAAMDATEARTKADRAAWAKATQEASKAGLARYLAAFPDGDQAAYARQAIVAIEASEARNKADRAAWAKAEQEGSKEALLRYLAAYPDGDNAAYARQTIGVIEASEARRDAVRTIRAEPPQDYTNDVLRRDVDALPERDAAGTTEKKSPLLETTLPSPDQARLRDDADWLKAQRRHTKASYAAYLLTHPNGRHAKEAHSSIDELVGPAAKGRPASSKVIKPMTQAFRSSPMDTPASQKWQSADEPFIGVDGRMRQR